MFLNHDLEATIRRLSANGSLPTQTFGLRSARTSRRIPSDYYPRREVTIMGDGLFGGDGGDCLGFGGGSNGGEGGGGGGGTGDND